MPVYLSRLKELDVDPKVMQIIEFVGQLKNVDTDYNATDVGNDQEARVTLTNTQLNKSKPTTKNKTGMNDIPKIIKSLEGFVVLIDGVTENVKQEIKKTRKWISWRFVSTFIPFNSTTSNFFSNKRHEWKRS